MERVNVVVLASLVAALALFGLRVFSPDAAPDLTAGLADAARPAFRPAGVHDRKLPPSRIAMHGGGGGRESRQPPAVPPPAEEKRRGSRGGSVTGGASADLIAGVERRRAVLATGQGGSADAFDVPAVELPDNLLAGRTGAVPPLRASGRDLGLPEADPNQRHTFEFVDDGPKKGGSDDVLLKLPFKGDVKAEGGGEPIQVGGLVTQGGQVEFPDGAQLVYPAAGNVNSNTGTIAFEIEPKWAGADATDNSLVQIRNEHIWENTLSIVKNLDSLRFIIIDSGGVERNVNIAIDDWAAGEARRLAATWDDSSMALYVNGQQVGQNTLPHPLEVADSTPIHIGSDFPGASYLGAGGTITNFTIYGRALGADEISTQ